MGRHIHWLLLGTIALLWLITGNEAITSTPSSILDNGVIGDPKVNCMEDRLKLTFSTERPFNGRIFVKGMIDNEKCVNSYSANSKQTVDFQLVNGACNMRRSRKLGPEQRGVEQSITVIISFHDIFITVMMTTPLVSMNGEIVSGGFQKVDRAYRCTCFYMEADRVVTNRFDVSMLPTTELLDTAKMPLCTYTVRRGSVNGPIVTYATVGEPVFHVWNCDSDMFSMLVHNCFVDDGAGKDRKPLIDEHGCTMDTVIVPDLQYNNQANLAYSEVNVFKFADKITTYFQCAVSTCMISEGMCKGKTPPRCGNNRKRRTIAANAVHGHRKDNSTSIYSDEHTMDLSAGKIVVLDLDDSSTSWTESNSTSHTAAKTTPTGESEPPTIAAVSRLSSPITQKIDDRYNQLTRHSTEGKVCFSFKVVSILACSVTFLMVASLGALLTYYLCNRHTARSKF